MSAERRERRCGLSFMDKTADPFAYQGNPYDKCKRVLGYKVDAT